MTETTLKSYPILWFINIDCNRTTLFWDSQMYKQVLYEYIECYVEISEICANIFVNLWRSNITLFPLKIHNLIIQS